MVSASQTQRCRSDGAVWSGTIVVVAQRVVQLAGVDGCVAESGREEGFLLVGQDGRGVGAHAERTPPDVHHHLALLRTEV